MIIFLIYFITNFFNIYNIYSFSPKNKFPISIPFQIINENNNKISKNNDIINYYLNSHIFITIKINSSIPIKFNLQNAYYSINERLVERSLLWKS